MLSVLSPFLIEARLTATGTTTVDEGTTAVVAGGRVATTGVEDAETRRIEVSEKEQRIRIGLNSAMSLTEIPTLDAQRDPCDRTTMLRTDRSSCRQVDESLARPPEHCLLPHLRFILSVAA